MSTLKDTPARYGAISRALHWGMAALFLLQFLSAAAHWALPRENGLRDLLWSYHSDLGMTLFALVLIRGLWGLLNMRTRPTEPGFMGHAAAAGHAVLYALMIIVPGLRILSTIGGTRGFSYLGMQLMPARETAVEWMRAPAEWHGELGWILALVILGHILMAVGYHTILRRDGTLQRMAG